MGAVLPFDANKADFSGIAQDPSANIHISLVLHKAFIEVNEEGTEAAAATAVVMKLGSSLNLPREFFCDRPFLFMIHDNVQNNILFLGKYTNPK